MRERQYFSINEGLAKTAHDMMSMSDYRPGSKTAEYKVYANRAYDIAERIEAERPKQADRAWKIATAYARRMADNLNAASRIGTMCPSVLISGAGNFPVKKKEKQNAASDRNFAEFNEIQGYISKLEGILHGKEVIRSDDEDAIILLEEKISKLEAEQEFMKEVNAYYRKNKKLYGCPELTPEQAAKIEASMRSAWNNGDQPFASYTLTNNSANIRRLRERLEKLKKEKSKETTETEHDDLGVTVKENVEEMRLQLFFDGKPEPETRDLLKGWGFKWSPRNGCWQRQLTDNARYATKQVMEKLKEMQGGDAE